jgi:hypothetical protein
MSVFVPVKRDKDKVRIASAVRTLKMRLKFLSAIFWLNFAPYNGRVGIGVFGSIVPNN